MTTRQALCLCGNPAVTVKNTYGVCARCDRLERTSRRQRLAGIATDVHYYATVGHMTPRR